MRLASLVAFVAILGFATSAAAEEPSDSASDEEKASKHFSKGAELFLQEKYEQAIIEFQRAYNYQKNPMILYNQAVPHARIGNYSKAIEVAERAGEGELPKKPSTKNDARIAAWSVAVTAQSSTDTVAANRTSESTAPGSSTTGGRTAPPPDRSGGTSMTGLGWTGIGLGVLGAGGIGYGIYVDRSLSDDIRVYKRAAAEGKRDRYDTLGNRIETRQQRGRIALYGGISAAALGAVLWTIDRLTGPRQLDPTLSLSGGGRGGDLGLTLQF